MASSPQMPRVPPLPSADPFFALSLDLLFIAAPDGALLIGLSDEQPVTGGAFRRFDSETAELKRVWTDRRFRRRGLARALLAALECEIAVRGYRRVYLTTGDRQPEAEALYLSAGYTRLPQPLPAEGDVYPVAFEKTLPA